MSRQTITLYVPTPAHDDRQDLIGAVKLIIFLFVAITVLYFVVLTAIAAGTTHKRPALPYSWTHCEECKDA